MRPITELQISGPPVQNIRKGFWVQCLVALMLIPVILAVMLRSARVWLTNSNIVPTESAQFALSEWRRSFILVGASDAVLTTLEVATIILIHRPEGHNADLLGISPVILVFDTSYLKLAKTPGLATF